MNEYIVRCLILLFKIMLLIMSPLTFAENRSGFVCGKFIETKLSISDEYLLIPPKYMSDDKHKDDDDCNNKFEILQLFATWPEMSPTRHQSLAEANIEYENGYKEIWIMLVPTTRTDTDLRSHPYFIGDKPDDNVMSELKIDESLGLFYIDKVEGIESGGAFMVRNYWIMHNCQVPIIIKCLYVPKMKDYTECGLVFVFLEANMSIVVRFHKDKLPQWKEILTSTKTFILSHIKK
ncbi:hypothetical protein [Yersinia intermedia]|uniref:hypothetical protein n=1 Tax=Yersinia intermedia TaxID=631 RepID=UPI0011A1BA85|nr:hypothetical protein [Yersinia intermedia]